MAKRTRASNGMGSVRQRGPNLWEGRYTAPDGKQKSVYGRTEKEVVTKLRGKFSEIDRGAWREPSKMTVGEWLDIWLADYQGDNTSRTVIKYKSIVDHNFKPVLGDLKLTKLSQFHIRRLITGMKERKLSQVTIKNYMVILGAALKRAKEARLIRENPVDDVHVSKGKPKKFHIVERAMFPAFIDAAHDTAYENELIFMLYTGLRIGEMRGLRWADVDFENGTVSVSRQLHPQSKSEERFTPPKYGEDRTIHLPKEAVDVLRAQRRKQAEQRIKAGADWVKDELCADLVFRQPNGSAHGVRTLAPAVSYVGRMIGVPELHPHDLRHSYAVAALRSGADVKTVQHNLGHKTASMTLDVYIAYTDDAGKEGAEKLSKFLQNQAD